MNAAQVQNFTGFGQKFYNITSESKKIFNEIFDILKRIKPSGDRNYRQAWFKVPRGYYLDCFEDVEDALDYYGIKDESKLQAEYEKSYPDDYYWFQFDSIEDKYARALQINRFFVIEEADSIHNEWERDLTEILAWIKEMLLKVIKECEDGTYNDKVKNELPYAKRYGVISRKDFWEVRPDRKEAELKDLTDDEFEKFISIIQNEEKPPRDRIKNMTFNQYFKFAILAHKNAGLNIDENASLFRQFECNAEDFGGRILDGLDHDSPDDFYRFYKGEWRMGGHPWGLLMGSSRSRIMLWPELDDNGYYFLFGGNPNWSIYEMIKMYLALKEAGLPVAFCNANESIAYLKTEDLVGIVSEDDIPVYCQSKFNEVVGDFYH
ncbi:MAG: hypothetical protein U0M60_06240, partial [Clostridia bacterium]|nr:hypothetical protein [Clostridia bacterium]